MDEPQNVSIPKKHRHTIREYLPKSGILLLHVGLNKDEVMMKKAIMTLLVLILSGTFTNAKELYRAPSAGDQGSYYIIESKKLDDGIIQVLSIRIGKGNAYTDFTELKVNCKLKQYIEIAGSEEDGAKDKPTEPLKDISDQSKWTSIVAGSSKYDLVQYICKKKKY